MGGRSKDGSLERRTNKVIVQKVKSTEEILSDVQKTTGIVIPFLGVKEVIHILDGEDDRRTGGHRFGTGNPGKSEFPSRWSDEMILDAIFQTGKFPDRVTTTGNIRYRWKEINNVIIEIKTSVTKTGENLIHAFPKSGDDVIMNTQNGPMEVPLDRTILEGKRD